MEAALESVGAPKLGAEVFVVVNDAGLIPVVPFEGRDGWAVLVYSSPLLAHGVIGRHAHGKALKVSREDADHIESVLAGYAPQWVAVDHEPHPVPSVFHGQNARAPLVSFPRFLEMLREREHAASAV